MPTIVYGGSVVSKATLTSTDKFSLDAIDKAVTMAQTEGGGSDGKMRIRPAVHGRRGQVCPADAPVAGA